MSLNYRITTERRTDQNDPVISSYLVSKKIYDKIQKLIHSEGMYARKGTFEFSNDGGKKNGR